MLTEKPIAISLQDADRMLEVQKETGVKLGCIFQTRYTKSVEKLREMIQRGDFGKILTARSYLTWNRPLNYYDSSDWKGTWDKEGGGVLIDQAIHSIDRVRFMLDSDVEWIDGSVHNYAAIFLAFLSRSHQIRSCLKSSVFPMPPRPVSRNFPPFSSISLRS